MSELPCPIRSIELRNFKSIVHAKVDLKPLTVLVGANSSGKSSLNQAIRVLSQAVQSHARGAEFPLNGKSVRLGSFQEARTFGADPDAPMEIEVTVAGDDGRVLSVAIQIMEPLREGRGSGRINSIRIAAAGGGPPGRPERRVPKLRCLLSGIAHDTSLWRRTPVGIDVVSASLWDTLLQHDHPAPSCTVSGALTTGTPEVSERFEAVDIVGGLPRQLFVSDSESTVARLGARWWHDTWASIVDVFGPDPEELRSGGHDDLADFVEPLFSDGLQPHELTPELVDHLFGAHGAELVDGGFVVEFAAKSLRYAYGEESLRDAEQGLTREQVGFDMQTRDDRLTGHWQDVALQDKARVGKSMTQTELGEFVRLLELECSNEVWAKRPILRSLETGSTEHLHKAVNDVASSLSRLKYLGPLRQPPDSFGDRGDPYSMDVGAAGEHAAAILHSHRERRVQVPWKDGNPRLMTLERALEHWLAELGIGDSVSVDDRGRFGLGLQVSPAESGRSLDLTAVGVGVSQVLPVLVACLLAHPGDPVILEQPELHLHPALQMKLADFLVAVARSGRQLIVETHSEHLVNRLRRWVAEDESDELGSLVGLLFAQRDEEGDTSFRASDINPLGGLSEDWPDGFLDLGAREAQKLLLGALDKRRRTK